MKAFLDDNFLLPNTAAERLYHDYAKSMPIVDYHCHLSPRDIAENKQFKNLTEAWLTGDHYKWRAMRANGVNEAYITGSRSDFEKFEQWAYTVPYTLRNPLYHWTHLELARYFSVTDLLSPTNAKPIYDKCSEQLQQTDMSVCGLIRKMDVRVICTTDDPLDDLGYHQHIQRSGFEVKVLPTFRPDKAMNVDDVPVLNDYIDKLSALTNLGISTYCDYLQALKSRHDYFAERGCKMADHGLDRIYAEDFTEPEIKQIFDKIRGGGQLTSDESAKFKSALLLQFGLWNHEKGWVQQFHLGALRNNNTRAFRTLGPDTGWDSIGDFSQAQALSRFLDKLDTNDQLAKTIIYNLNPADNELMAAMIGNFNDGSVAGKIQFGSAWWFMDQKDGMTRQLNALSNMGLLSRMVGMLTDSRSFLSFPRHEYFRRILCSLLGTDIENGELPGDFEWIGQVVKNISYHNAEEYFKF
ncbi:glucuronate isomerase [Mucilaginibacter ginkgonis]|uniref:Uronate isomerase n=1 Tax=Mucilaginibacter ginkgonis TaxID=2682091 RepID=A0A6I4I2J0_9SPHI|nr:glucuronate isomerase [Mucilaginibacter ginkgonis]QQL49451.1 glucuronate isomerase [Mucilaginibacter ginkgonis]